MSDETPSHVVRQEPEGLHGGLVFTVIAVAIVITVLCIVVVAVMLHAQEAALAGVPAPPAYPAARTIGKIEQTPSDGPPRGLEKVEAEKRALGQYGWVDRRRGIAQIPIDRAMRWFVDDETHGRVRTPDFATTADAGVDGEVGR